MLHFGLALDCGAGALPLPSRFDKLRTIVRAAEEYDLDSLWLGEAYPTGADDLRGFHLPNPFVLIAALADSSPRMRFGTAVNLVSAWHPLRLAYDSALTDALLDGRLTLGLGLGPESLSIRFGNSHVSRSTHLEETVDLLRTMWRVPAGASEEMVTAEAGMWPLPKQPGGPHILIGGGVTASARRAARIGDGYFASSGYDLSRIEKLAHVYRQEIAATVAPGMPSSVHVAVNRITLVSEDRHDLQHLAQTYVHPLLNAYSALGTTQLDPAAPVDSCGQVALCGSADEVVQQVRKYVDIGVTHLQFRICLGDMPTDAVLECLHLLGTIVIPAFR